MHPNKKYMTLDHSEGFYIALTTCRLPSELWDFEPDVSVGILSQAAVDRYGFEPPSKEGMGSLTLVTRIHENHPLKPHQLGTIAATIHNRIVNGYVNDMFLIEMDGVEQEPEGIIDIGTFLEKYPKTINELSEHIEGEEIEEGEEWKYDAADLILGPRIHFIRLVYSSRNIGGIERVT
jgi:hypothetical protein